MPTSSPTPPPMNLASSTTRCELLLLQLDSSSLPGLAAGREITAATWLNLIRERLEEIQLRSLWKLTRVHVRLPRSTSVPHTQFDWAWHSTSLCSITRSLGHQTRHATWPRPPLRMQWQTWTSWRRRATRTQLSSCSCYGTTMPSGPLTSREVSSEGEHYSQLVK